NKTSVDSNSKLDLVNAKEREIGTYNLLKSDVLFVRSSVKPIGVGLTAVVSRDLENTTYGGFIIRGRMDEKFNIRFLEYVFRSETIRRQVMSMATISANTNINQPSLSRIRINY